MNKKTSRIMTTCLAATIGLGALTPSIDAANLTKTLNAIYRNITVSYNGAVQSMSVEPFVVDGSVYVPLRAMSEITGATVNWDNTNSKVSITAPKVDTADKDKQISTLTYENAMLKQQLAVAQAENTALKAQQNGSSNGSTSGNTSSVDSVLERIIDDFGSKYKIDWEFNLIKKSTGLELEVSYDSKYDSDLYDRLSDTTLKSFIQSIIKEISTTFTSTAIEGKLIDSRYDMEKANFSYSKTGKFTFESRAALIEDLEFDLERKFRGFDGLSFDLPIDAITLEESNDVVVFTVLVNLLPSAENDLRNNWNAISSSTASTKVVSNLMLDLSDYIETDLGMLVEGYVKDDYSGNIIATFDGRRTTINSRQ